MVNTNKMKKLMHFISISLFTLGDVSSHIMLRYDWAFLYPLYKWCMSKSLWINEKFDLNVWTKP